MITPAKIALATALTLLAATTAARAQSASNAPCSPTGSGAPLVLSDAPGTVMTDSLAAAAAANPPAPQAFVLQAAFEKSGKPANYDRALAATISTNYGGFDPYCTATHISNSGYLVTALHCARECLSSPEGMQGDIVSYVPIAGASDPDAQLAVIDHDKLAREGVSCLRAEGHHWVKYKVVATPAKGWIPEGTRQSLDPNIESRLIQQGYGLDNDIIVLKREESAGPAPACVPVAAQDAAPGAPVWSIQFPYYYRSGDKDDTYDRRFTRGQISASEQGLVTSTIDAESGGSGGPTFDAAGELVSVNSYVSKGDTTDYVSGTTHAIAASRIRAAVTAALGPSAAAAAFDCKLP